MGYHTEFEGRVTVTPPLNEHEAAYLAKFSRSRRMARAAGPYIVDGDDRTDDVIDYNEPPRGQPGLWCQWVPVDEGKALAWDGLEKFYYAAEWMSYVIDTFLRPNATLRRELRRPMEGQIYPDAFAHFTFDHHVEGVIHAAGEDPEDRWSILVRDNEVLAQY